jgi:hypothetical protein
VDTCIKNLRGVLNYLEGHYLRTLSYLKENVAGSTNLSKTQRMISLLFAVLRVMSFFFSNIFSAHKIAIICSVHILCLLNWITETIPVNGGSKYCT